MTTYGDFFTGFGGMTIGAQAAGFDVLFGVEYDADIADVYRRNLGDHVHVADLTTFDVTTLPRVDVFHASPPCTNASVANANGGEAPVDMALARATADYIRHALPTVVTLENVYTYRNFESWHLIARALLDSGYTYAFWHVNMADYGVPQTRKRMIVVARRDGKTPMLPAATHAKDPQPGLFGMLAPWVSWFDATADLHDTLPESQFAPWQLERLPDEFGGGILTDAKNSRSFRNGQLVNEPLTAKTTSEPVWAVQSNAGVNHFRAWLCEPSNASGGSDRWQGEPSQAVTTPTGGRAYRAFIANGTTDDNGQTMTVCVGDAPVYTQTSSHYKRPQRAAIAGRVVKMTPRAIARFQSFPDWYELPDSATLAVKGIGNAVPPLFAEKLYKSIGRTL